MSGVKVISVAPLANPLLLCLSNTIPHAASRTYLMIGQDLLWKLLSVILIPEGWKILNSSFKKNWQGAELGTFDGGGGTEEGGERMEEGGRRMDEGRAGEEGSKLKFGKHTILVEVWYQVWIKNTHRSIEGRCGSRDPHLCIRYCTWCRRQWDRPPQ